MVSRRMSNLAATGPTLPHPPLYTQACLSIADQHQSAWCYMCSWGAGSESWCKRDWTSHNGCRKGEAQCICAKLCTKIPCWIVMGQLARMAAKPVCVFLFFFAVLYINCATSYISSSNWSISMCTAVNIMWSRASLFVKCLVLWMFFW